MHLPIAYKLQTLCFSSPQAKPTVFAFSTSLLLLHQESHRRAGEVDCGRPGWAALGGCRVRGRGRESFRSHALLTPTAPRRQDAPVRRASAHLLRAAETLALSVPGNSFLLLGPSSSLLSGLSYCQFIFIKITILARHWEIRETTNLVLMKRRH